jgi:hypothetical protein
MAQQEVNMLERLLFLGLGAVLATLSGLAKYLTEHEQIRRLPLMGGLLGSGLASFSFAALMIEMFQISNLLVLAIAGPIGWLGGDIMASLGRRYLRQIEGAKET